MSLFGWKSFLEQWSQTILESMPAAQLSHLPPEVVKSGWLGYPGATENQLAQVEAQLQMRLPPSYREFLKVSNGWRQTTPFIHKLWSTEGIAPFASRHWQWIEAFTVKHETAPLSLSSTHDLEDVWEPIRLTDAEYLIYGEEQDCSQLRLEYLKTAIEISDVGESAIYLLNPQVVNEEGEWEAWFFADWLPGADRYRSFKEMMEAEYQNFLELRDPTLEQSLLPEEQSPTREIGENAELSGEVTETNLASTIDVESQGWRSLKRLAIELQARQIGDCWEYRAFTHADSTQPPRCWAASEFPLLQSWICQQLVEAEIDKQVEQVASPEMVSFPSRSVPVAANSAPEPVVQVRNLILEIDQLEIRQNAYPPACIQINSSQLKQTTKPIVRDSLLSQIPFSLEVVCQLVGQQCPDQSFSAITYTAQFYAQNRMTGQWVVLGETQAIALKSARHTYTARLHGRTLETGLYRLQVFTTLHGAVAALASFELPLLNVA